MPDLRDRGVCHDPIGQRQIKSHAGVPGREGRAWADRTLAQLAEQFDVHPNQITSWKAQLESGAADVFGPGGGSTAQPAIDVKSLHAKIGELTLENEILEGALTKAGLLSAKR